MWLIYSSPRAVRRLVPSKIQIRHASAREVLGKADLNAKGDVAKRLADTNVWRGHRAKTRAKVLGDKTRVNITSDKLCDDIDKYLGPSLQRHVGCDLLDLFPGPGVWSRKLHDIVKPRRHILMEPDEDLYAPFLEQLTSRPNTTLVPKSGLIWSELNNVLDSLPHQKARDPGSGEPPQRNDSLLVTVNLASYPKTKMTSLYIFQLIAAIRSGTIFQRYGLVRMLIWMRPEDMRPTILPNAVHFRSRGAVEAELSCEWINEVAGPDSQDKALQASLYNAKRMGSPRERAIELESTRRALERLKEQGISIPEGRETAFMKEVRTGGGKAEELGREVQAQGLASTYAAELKELKRAYQEGEFDKKSDNYKRMQTLRHRESNNKRQAGSYGELLREYGELLRMHAEGVGEDKIRVAEEAWNDKVSDLNQHSLSNFRLLRDNLHLFRQEPPVMLWDRRTLEPLTVSADEFFPNVPCSLLDVQPKAPNPIMSSHKEGLKVFELLIKVMMLNSRIPVSERLDDVWTDASEAVLCNCPSLRDQKLGGTGVRGHGEVSVRALNEVQWGEIVGAWLKWHFRPGVDTLVMQHVEGVEDDDEEGGALGSSELLM